VAKLGHKTRTDVAEKRRKEKFGCNNHDDNS